MLVALELCAVLNRRRCDMTALQHHKNRTYFAQIFRKYRYSKLGVAGLTRLEAIHEKQEGQILPPNGPRTTL